MSVFETIGEFMGGGSALSVWLIAFVVTGVIAGTYTGYFRARKIQPNGFRWRTFRNEALFAALNMATAAFVLYYISATLTKNGVITYNEEPASWWVIAIEYGLYALGFDTYFYWLHRLMHVEPVYKYVHKLHHYSTSPNLLTTLSVSPIESLINGAWVPLFTAALTVHTETLAFILPTNIIMGLYVHSGYEFLPRWWNKTWFTKWFITTTFHDQHHKYFNWNFGGYFTIWDYLCGTVRPKYEADFDRLKDRADKTAPVVAAAEAVSSEAK